MDKEMNHFGVPHAKDLRGVVPYGDIPFEDYPDTPNYPDTPPLMKESCDDVFVNDPLSKAQFLEFQVHFAKVVDFVGDPRRKFHDDFGKTRGRRCTVLLKGRTLEGQGVLLRVKGFRPWFYVLDDDPEGTGIDKGRLLLKEIGVDLSRWNYKYDSNYQIERKRLGDGCEPDPATGGATIIRRLVYRILSPNMKTRKTSIEKLKKKYLAEDDDQCSALVQFYSSTGIRPMSWVKVDLSKTKRYSTGTLTWSCTHELRTEIENIKAIEENNTMAPFRVVVMDIETDSYDGSFPDPNHIDNKILIIGVRQKIYNSPEPNEKGIQFCLYDTEPDPENRYELRCYEQEPAMLCAYANYIKKEFDADAIVTWNGRGFDNNYLATRASKCSPSVQEIFFKFSVLKYQTCRSQEKSSSKSKQSDKRKSYLWKSLFGRLDLDLMLSVKNDLTEKHRSYSLNYISKVLLGEQKVDLPAKILWKNHRMGPQKRMENCVYCDKDCMLPLRIMEKKKTLGTLMQLANVCYTEMDDLLSKGQTIKVWNLIHVHGYLNGFVINHLDVEQPKGYQGAYVLPPKRGLLKGPISVLDFKSLYPSIMIEHNLCYSTECQTEIAKQMPNAKYDCPQIECENGSVLRPVFYQNEPGLLPVILKHLLYERSVAKKNMSRTKNPDEKSVLNGRQLALKVSANSVYGFTGATLAKMPRLTISATVTYYGRLGLFKTKNLVESKYTPEFCHKVLLKKETVPKSCQDRKTEVVGGDTDSVFVAFPVEPTREGLLDSIAIAKVASAECTKLFQDPMELEYENTYMPMFIKEKKRYIAGTYITGHEILEDLPDDKWESGITVKGMEMVRRDVPPFTSNLMKQIARQLFIYRNVENAYNVMNQEMERFCRRDVPIMELIMSGQLGEIEDYANPDNLAHVNVVQKMKARDPGSEPRTGDRVLYVYIKNNKSDKAADKAEDVGYVMNNNIELDLEYYFDHKIYNPVIQLFRAVDPHVELKFQSWKQYVTAKNQNHGSVFADLQKVGVSQSITTVMPQKTQEIQKDSSFTEFTPVDMKRKRKKSEVRTEVRAQMDGNSLVAFCGKPCQNTDFSDQKSMPITSSVQKNVKRAKRSKGKKTDVITNNIDRNSLFGATVAKK